MFSAEKRRELERWTGCKPGALDPGYTSIPDRQLEKIYQDIDSHRMGQRLVKPIRLLALGAAFMGIAAHFKLFGMGGLSGSLSMMFLSAGLGGEIFVDKCFRWEGEDVEESIRHFRDSIPITHLERT